MFPHCQILLLQLLLTDVSEMFPWRQTGLTSCSRITCCPNNTLPFAAEPCSRMRMPRESSIGFGGKRFARLKMALFCWTRSIPLQKRNTKCHLFSLDWLLPLMEVVLSPFEFRGGARILDFINRLPVNKIDPHTPRHTGDRGHRKVHNAVHKREAQQPRWQRP